MLDNLTHAQREAVLHEAGPLLIIAGAGTGKTTVITRRIAWLIATKHARPDEILALTFTEKAAAEMEERVDLLVPYGYTDVTIRTFHAFGDELLRSHAVSVGLSPQFRVLSKAEQLVFLRQHVFELPLEQLRPPRDPTRYLEALARVFARAKDEAVSPQEFLSYAKAKRAPADRGVGERLLEVAQAYAAYERLLRQAAAVDFGDLVLLAIWLLEQAPEVLAAVHRRFRHVLVDEFQDTNYAQFRLLQLLAAPNTHVSVVADDDQSIYKWRGAAISNVLKFLDQYPSAHTTVLTENFRSPQPILDAAYRLIRFNDPDRLEVHKGIDKRLIAQTQPGGQAPHVHVFDTASSEADWVARTIRAAVDAGSRRPKDFAILVRSNREADLFLRALNVAGIPWQFSGASGLLARAESKMFLSCLKALADPEDSLSWYHVASSSLYRFPMDDLTKILAQARKTNRSVRTTLEGLEQDPSLAASLTDEGRKEAAALLGDVRRLWELSRTASAGQVLYRWLADRGLLSRLGVGERPGEAAQLQTMARFFDHLHRIEELVGGNLQEVIQHLELFEAIGNERLEEEDYWADRVSVLTIHKAKGLEFPAVFLVGLIQGRFPTPHRGDPIELPDALVKDILPSGNYHLQEERRLFYVGMTRAKEELYLTCAYDHGGKTLRKVSQFVLEALDLASPSPPARTATAAELIGRSRSLPPIEVAEAPAGRGPLRLDAHGADDYLTCPLKYRYSHVLRIPVMRHHLVAYGAALHKAIEQFFRRQLQGQRMGEEELLQVFETHWSSEGYLTRQHEELRLAQGQQTLRRFFREQQESPEQPSLIEEKFKFALDDILVVGRWDRVDDRGDDVVIIDYKSSDVQEPAAANRQARESLQMLVYALAWRTVHGKLPTRVELRFLESGITGEARFTEEDLDRARSLLRQAARGIRAREYPAKPQEHACRWCAFQAICPFAFQLV